MTTALLNPQANTGKAITRGSFPKTAQTLYVPLDFTGGVTQIQVDLPLNAGIVNQAGIDGAQSLFFDNSSNGSVVEITFSNNFEITLPPYSSGIIPLLIATGTGVKFVAISNGGALAKTWLTNTREQPAIWITAYPITGNFDVSGSNVYTSPLRATISDASKALAVGGVSEQLVAANGNRLGIFIKNPGTPTGQGIAAPEPAYINFGTAATIGGSSIELLPGETITAASIGITPTQAINWIAATTSHQLICKVS